MKALNISLPESMRDFVEEQIRRGAYGTASEYIRSLIRADQRNQAQNELESLLLAGLESGDAETMTQDDWDAIRRQLHRRLGERRGRAG